MASRMKTTIQIPDPLLREAQRVAKQQGRTLRQLVEIGLRYVITEERRKVRSFRLKDAGVGGRGLREGLRGEDWSRILELAYEDRG